MKYTCIFQNKIWWEEWLCFVILFIVLFGSNTRQLSFNACFCNLFLHAILFEIYEENLLHTGTYLEKGGPHRSSERVPGSPGSLEHTLRIAFLDF